MKFQGRKMQLRKTKLVVFFKDILIYIASRSVGLCDIATGSQPSELSQFTLLRPCVAA